MFDSGSYTVSVPDRSPREIIYADRTKARGQILALEAAMRAEIASGNLQDVTDDLPLEHHFIPGVYGRRLSMPAGTVVVGKIHRNPCFNFIAKGTVTFASPDGVRTVTAPHFFVSPGGTKRGIVAHTDAVWITAHGSHETDLEKLEAELICDSFEQFDGLPALESK